MADSIDDGIVAVVTGAVVGTLVAVVATDVGEVKGVVETVATEVGEEILGVVSTLVAFADDGVAVEVNERGVEEAGLLEGVPVELTDVKLVGGVAVELIDVGGSVLVELTESVGEVIPEGVLVGVVIPVEVGVVIVPVGEVVVSGIPVPVDVGPVGVGVPEGVTVGPVEVPESVAEPVLEKMLEITLARSVLDDGGAVPGPVIPDEISVTPVEAGPVIPEGSLVVVGVGTRFEVTSLTTELRAEVGRIPVSVEDGGAVPVEAGDVGAVPTALVTPETTELKRDVTGERMPLSVGVAEAGAVEPPLPEKETPEVTLSGVVVVAGASLVLDPPRIPDGPKRIPPVLEEAGSDDGTVSLGLMGLVVVGAITVEGAEPVDPAGICVVAAVLG